MTNENDPCCDDECFDIKHEDKYILKTGDEMANTFGKMANEAWDALMREKMRVHWEKHMGKEMEKIALASVELSMAWHMNEMKKKEDISAAVEKLHESMKM